MLLTVKPLRGEVFTLDINDETTILPVIRRIHHRSEYRNMSILDLKIADMNGKDWGLDEHDLKISELSLQEENTVRLFTHRLEQRGFWKGYDAALKDIASDKDIGSDKDDKGIVEAKDKDIGSDKDDKGIVEAKDKDIGSDKGDKGKSEQVFYYYGSCL